MNNQLRIFYMNGELFNVNLTPVFFTEHKVSAPTRVLDIAHSRNPAPWKIFLFKEGRLLFEKIIAKNDPALLHKNEQERPTLVPVKSVRLAIVKKMKKQWLGTR